MACQEPTTAGDEVGDPGTEDGDGDGDPDGGDENTDGPGDGDGDGGPGDGDGDADPDGALLRLLHLGIDVPAVDVYLDGEADPIVAAFSFGSGTDYVKIPAGAHSVTITPVGEPDMTMLSIAPLDLVEGVKYSAVAFDYLANFRALALIDDDSNIDPEHTRLQVTHAALDLGQVDIWSLADPPVMMLEDLDVGATKILDIPAGPSAVGIDVDDDGNADLSFGIPDLGAGELIDVYAVNEAGGSPVFLLAHLPGGSTERIDVDACGDDVATGSEVCDGSDVGEMSCADFGKPMGQLVCLPDCSGYDVVQCTPPMVFCDAPGAKVPDGKLDNPLELTIDVADVGTVADVRLDLDFTHPYLGDLEVTLDKDGMNATAMFADILDLGGEACMGNDMLAMLDDNAQTSILTEACSDADKPAVDGTFAPMEPLSNFDGMGMAGTWHLVVADDNKGDTGTINEWCLYITPE